MKNLSGRVVSPGRIITSDKVILKCFKRGDRFLLNENTCARCYCTIQDFEEGDLIKLRHGMGVIKYIIQAEDLK